MIVLMMIVVFLVMITIMFVPAVGIAVGVVKVTGFTDTLDDTPARKRRPTRQVRATQPMQSSVSDFEAVEGGASVANKGYR